MTVIHMETEQVMALAEKMKTSASLILQSWGEVMQRCYGMDWQGASRDELLQESFTRQKQINALAEQLDALSLALKGEVAQWEDKDKHFSNINSIGEQNLITSLMTNPFRDFRNSIIDLAGFLFGDKTLEDKFDFLNKDEIAGSFRKEVEESNLQFQLLDAEGNIINSFGADDGNVVTVRWADYEEGSNLGGGYDPGPPPTITINDELKTLSEYELRQVLTHEMQHAIDYQTGQSDINTRNYPFETIANSDWQTYNNIELQNNDWSSLEVDLEKSCYERVKTEIHAHDRGYEFDPKTYAGENMLNLDQNYTPDECKFVLNDRDYASYYEKNIRDEFAAKGLQADVVVYWDNTSNQIRVDIARVTNFIVVDGGDYA